MLKKVSTNYTNSWRFV